MQRAARAILGALVLANLIFLYANQMTLRDDYRLVVKPRDIEKVAEAHAHPVVNGRLALYHYLRQRIAGATLTGPPWAEEHRWYFERVARVKLVVDPTPRVLNRHRSLWLRRRSSHHRSFLRDGNKRDKRRWQVLHVAIDPAARDYLLVEGDGPKRRKLGPLFIAPVSTVEAVVNE